MLLRIGFVSALALLLTALTASAFTFEISFVPERVKQGKRASFTIELVGAPHEPIFKSQLNGIELMLADLRTGKRHILPIEPIVEFRKRSVKDVGLPVATHFRGGKDVVGQLNESGRYTFDGTFEVAKDLEPGLYRFIVWYVSMRVAMSFTGAYAL